MIPSRPPGASYLPALDGLRGFAAAIVLFSHFSNAFNLWDRLFGAGAGQHGVLLFFVLSGFLIAHLHLGQSAGPATIRAYLVRRFARIYPLFVLVAALPLLLRWAGLPPDLIRLPIIDSLAVYGRQIALIDPGHGMLWTVRVEIVFYGVFVAIWLLHRAIGHRWITALLLTVAAVAMEIDQTSFWFSPLNYLRHFLYGVILALLHRPGNHPRVANGLAMLALATLPLTVPMVWRHWTGHAVTAWQNPLVSLQMLLLLNGLLHPRGGLVPLFAAAPMRWMGQISYSTYLLHPFILTLLKGVLGRDTHPALVFPLFLLLTLALAQITYQRFELPMRRYFQRFQQAATTKPPDSA